MRRMIVALALGWGAGLLMAAGAAHGYALLNAWRGFGESFQLGYVVGYLDAVVLSSRHDDRVYIFTSTGVSYERWRQLVNDYFADPANAKRSLPDGMAAAAKVLRAEWAQRYEEQKKKSRSAASPAAPGSPGATTTPP